MRPAPRSETPRPAYRPDTFREDTYRQDSFRGDASQADPYRTEQNSRDPFRQETYRQEPFRADSFRQEPFRQEPFRAESFRQEPFCQETYFRPRRDTGYYNRELGTSNPAVPEMLATGECGDGSGILEIHPEGYGFLRAENFLPGNKDVYVSIAQIRRFGLRTGDHITGKTRPQREGDKYSALLYITDVNGIHPDDLRDRVSFDDLTPIYPSKRITLENSADNSDLAIRLVDLIAPIGFGQRALIVAPPKAGKTTILSKIANAITRNYPDVHVMVLLVDERPEEVTDLRESIQG
jgi:transcription termination factor Rho